MQRLNTPLVFLRWLTKVVQTLFSSVNRKYGRPYLTGNHAPQLEEIFEQNLQVEGTLPAELTGVYCRNGPNPLLEPVGGYHWFDGDGMLHAVRFKDGQASYCNRWVRTARWKQEQSAGWALFGKLGDMVGLQGVALMLLGKAKQSLGLIDVSDGASTANTALVHHAQQLLALNEGDLPYAIRVSCNGLLETIGRVTLSGKLGKTFTAHPKVDPETGKLHFYNYNFDAPPFVTYGSLSASGRLEHMVPITIPRPVMMHDFAITKSYAIFMDLPLNFDGERMVKEGGLPFRFFTSRPARLGLLPLGDQDETRMRWFELPAFMVFHTVNAWEDDAGAVRLYACHHETISLDLSERSQTGVPVHEQPRVYEYTMDPSTGLAAARKVAEVVCDFPVINPRLQGRRSRWAWAATMITDRAPLRFGGWVKLDLSAPVGQDAEAARIVLPPESFSGEAVFVPRHENPAQCQAEDDGFLLAFVHCETSGVSRLNVYDARTMAAQPLASVVVPQRVPYGFHGLFVNESRLQGALAADRPAA